MVVHCTRAPVVDGRRSRSATRERGGGVAGDGMSREALPGGRPAVECSTPLLEVGGGTKALLTTDPSGVSALEPRRIETDCIEEYKAWIGVDNETYRQGGASAHRWELPRRPWIGPSAGDPAELAVDELDDVQKALAAYLFADSAEVASYRRVLERLYAPFRAAIYAARAVRIEAGAQLTVVGLPAVLVFQQLDIVAGGQLRLMTVANARIGRLRRIG